MSKLFAFNFSELNFTGVPYISNYSGIDKSMNYPCFESKIFYDHKSSIIVGLWKEGAQNAKNPCEGLSSPGSFISKLFLNLCCMFFPHRGESFSDLVC